MTSICPIPDVAITPLYVILASAYVRIQQGAVHRQLKRLNQNLGIHNRKRWTPLGLHLRHFLVRNQRVLEISTDLSQYGHFWSLYLTIMFFTLIATQCYLSYVVLFSTSAVLLVIRVVFLFTVIIFTVLEFLLIDQCSRVVRWNKRILRQNSQFQLVWNQNRGKFAPLQLPAIRDLIKVESLQHQRLLHCYAFRVFGNHRITSKTFHMVRDRERERIDFCLRIFMILFQFNFRFSPTLASSFSTLSRASTDKLVIEIRII